MALRSRRHMTSLFLIHDDRVLLLYRIGSRAIPDSWVGVGGHIEPDELQDPTRALLRELAEEVGLAGDDLSDLALRYVSMRDTGKELRFTYYFTATLKAGVPEPTDCAEGKLHWFDLTPGPRHLPMPPTAAVALEHWLTQGRHDGHLRSVVMTANGPQVQPLPI